MQELLPNMLSVNEIQLGFSGDIENKLSVSQVK